MIKIENIDTWGFEHALRGMRNPYNSWGKSDSVTIESFTDIGMNDMELAKKLIKGGTEHRKFLRQIFVSMDITAPLFMFKEFDTYKIGVTSNSCSTMHTIMQKEFTEEDFSMEHLTSIYREHFLETIDYLNDIRNLYLHYEEEADKSEFPTKKDVWWQMIQMLPSSYNQTSNVSLNYENLYTMYHDRSGHKLDEWLIFRKYIFRILIIISYISIPY